MKDSGCRSVYPANQVSHCNCFPSGMKIGDWCDTVDQIIAKTQNKEILLYFLENTEKLKASD